MGRSGNSLINSTNILNYPQKYPKMAKSVWNDIHFLCIWGDLTICPGNIEIWFGSRRVGRMRSVIEIWKGNQESVSFQHFILNFIHLTNLNNKKNPMTLGTKLSKWSSQNFIGKIVQEMHRSSLRQNKMQVSECKRHFPF